MTLAYNDYTIILERHRKGCNKLCFEKYLYWLNECDGHVYKCNLKRSTRKKIESKQGYGNEVFQLKTYIT